MPGCVCSCFRECCLRHLHLHALTCLLPCSAKQHAMQQFDFDEDVEDEYESEEEWEAAVETETFSNDGMLAA